MARKRYNLAGRTFGRLEAARSAGTRRHAARWRCRCACGRAVTVRAADLLAGRVRSCGCLAREATARRNRRHGHAHEPTWNRWRAMLRRCYCEKATKYADYGGRGVRVCAGWLSYEQFLADLGPAPDGFQLDRLDNGGGYYCGSCFECRVMGRARNAAWRTPSANQRNKRTTVLLSVGGRTAPLADWAEAAGLPYALAYGRLRRGWPAESVLAPILVVNP